MMQTNLLRPNPNLLAGLANSVAPGGEPFSPVKAVADSQRLGFNAAKLEQLKQQLQQNQTKEAMQAKIQGILERAGMLKDKAMALLPYAPQQAVNLMNADTSMKRMDMDLAAQGKNLLDRATQTNTLSQYLTDSKYSPMEQAILMSDPGSTLETMRGNLMAQDKPEKLVKVDIPQGDGSTISKWVTPQEGMEYTTGLPESNTPEPAAFGDVMKLRKEHNSLVSDYRDLNTQIRKITDATPNSAGDMALIFSFMRLLDPGSVVRESEYAAAARTRGLSEELEGTYNKLVAGEQLTNDQRQRFKQEAVKIFQSQQEVFNEYTRQYKEIAKRYGIPEGDVIISAPSPSLNIQDDEITQQDLEHTAQTYGLTVEQVKQHLGVQ